MQENVYQHSTENSRNAYESAKQVIPGGVQGNIKFYRPYPLTFSSAQGAWLKDVDGNEYVDYLLSFGALILGHGHSVVKHALNEVWAEFGTSSFGVPYPLEEKMVKKLQSLYPSVKQLRFTNSGLEATLLAVRLGMAYTGKPSIAKFSGHYHGGHEQVLVSTRPGAEDGENPNKAAESLGLPDYFLDHTEVLPFHDLAACEKLLREKQDSVGVVVMEPLQSGYIPATREFMKGLRELTSSLGMVLVFDEVKTGFRISLGGAQEYYGIQPDLTALGKVLGGGFPVGAVGGRQEILELASPTRSTAANEVVFHSGTFNGNPVSLLAGLRTIEFLEREDHYAELLQTTQTLRRQIEDIGNRYGFATKTVGAGTIFNVVFPDGSFTGDIGPQTVAVERSEHHRKVRGSLDYLLMKHGVFSKPFNRFSLSAAHKEKEIEKTLDAFERSFSQLAQVIN